MANAPDMKRAVILGTGQMGLVMADALAARGAEVSMWGASAESVERLTAERVSPRLPALTLPAEVVVTSDAAAALREADVVINAIPAQFMRGVWEQFGGGVGASTPIVCVSKGIEVSSLNSPTDVMAEVLGRDPVGGTFCVLSGPTIAAELARRQPATMLAASTSDALARAAQDLFDLPWLRVYTSDDPHGVELAGAMKNVIALAAGMIDGLGLGNNAKSALLTRGLAETVRLGVEMGARQGTFFGVAGVGDLTTTCFSPEGRNRRCGEAIGRGMSLDDALASISSVVEGVETTRAIERLAERHGVEMPIVQSVHAILFESMAPFEAIRRLMQRVQKPERIG